MAFALCEARDPTRGPCFDHTGLARVGCTLFENTVPVPFQGEPK